MWFVFTVVICLLFGVDVFVGGVVVKVGCLTYLDLLL